MTAERIKRTQAAGGGGSGSGVDAGNPETEEREQPREPSSSLSPVCSRWEPHGRTWEAARQEMKIPLCWSVRSRPWLRCAQLAEEEEG